MRTVVRIMIASVALMLVATPFARAATLDPIAVFGDQAADNWTGEDVSPEAAMDLTGGFIGETDDALQFVWQVADLLDLRPATDAVPSHFAYYWDFTLQDPAGGAAVPFELSVTKEIVPGQNLPYVFDNSSISGNCITTANLITCTPIPNSLVTVGYDPTANTITANVRRQDLRVGDGASLAIDGAILAQTQLFEGIAACPTLVVIASGNTCDLAAMDDDYILGSPRE